MLSVYEIDEIVKTLSNELLDGGDVDSVLEGDHPRVVSATLQLHELAGLDERIARLNAELADKASFNGELGAVVQVVVRAPVLSVEVTARVDEAELPDANAPRPKPKGKPKKAA